MPYSKCSIFIRARRLIKLIGLHLFGGIEYLKGLIQALLVQPYWPC
jgi:hypothetical protein